MRNYILLVVLLLLCGVYFASAATVESKKPVRVYTAKYDVVNIVDLSDLLKRISQLDKRIKELEKNE